MVTEEAPYVFGQRRSSHPRLPSDQPSTAQSSFNASADGAVYRAGEHAKSFMRFELKPYTIEDKEADRCRKMTAEMAAIIWE